MRILLVDDDEKLCGILKCRLKESQIACDVCHHGQEAEEYITRDAYDVIVLDRMLPGKDGLSILKQMREGKNETPVIMVTALGQLENRVEGLDGGADDYLSKPFEVEELLARVRALARRKSKAMESPKLEYGDFLFDSDRMTICRKDGQEKVCHMSKREADLLVFFLKNQNRVLSRELLLDRVWGIDSEVMDSNLDNFICFLRKRLRSIDSTCKIHTVRGVGYRLEQ